MKISFCKWLSTSTTIVLISSVISFAHCAAQSYDLSLIPYRKGDKWGYCDPQKKVIIAPQFTETSFFEGALCIAKADSYYCVINRKGNVVFRSTRYTHVINSGAEFVTGENSYSAQVFDAQGNAVTKKYNGVENFNKYGYLPVTADFVKKGLLDRSFNEVVPPKYGSIEFFTKDLIRIYDPGLKKYGLYDLNGKRQFATSYDMIYPPGEGLMMVRKDDHYGFIDMQGNEVIAARYDKETPVRIQRGERFNEYTYEAFNYDGFYGGRAVVVEKGMAGYLDKSGNTVIPFVFEKAFGFQCNYAWVMKSGKWGMIDKSGSYVLKPIYTGPTYLSAKELEVLDGFHEGLVAVAVDSLYGYADTTGKMVLPFMYTRAEPFFDGLAAVYAGDKLGMINRRGEMVIRPQYQWIEGAGAASGYPFMDGCGIAYGPGGEQTIIDKKGKKILPITFDANNRIWFQGGVADATAGGKRYIFTNKGQILYTLDSDDMVMLWSNELMFSYHDKCYINIRTKIKYCD